MIVAGIQNVPEIAETSPHAEHTQSVDAANILNTFPWVLMRMPQWVLDWAKLPQEPPSMLGGHCTVTELTLNGRRTGEGYLSTVTERSQYGHRSERDGRRG
jgi:hypothetical protein